MVVKEGDHIPDATLYMLGETGLESFKTSELFSGRTTLVCGLPGAFTPLCSQVQAPSFLEYADEFYDKGVEQIVCISVNDAFVMGAWADELHADTEILFLGDGNGEFTKALGLELDGRALGLGFRSQRYAMLVEDGIIKMLRVEGAPDVCTISGAKHFLDQMD